MRDSGYIISRIALLSNRQLNKRLAQAHIDSFNSEQGKILYVLWQGDGLTLTELANKTNLALNTLSKMVSTMEASDLVERRSDAADKRSKRIYLAAKGRQAQEDTEDISSDMERLFYKHFTTDEINEFDRLLKQVLKNFAEAEKEL